MRACSAHPEAERKATSSATTPLLRERQGRFRGACRAFFLKAPMSGSPRVQVLHVSMLHLGHLAKAYALKETPSLLSRQQVHPLPTPPILT